TCAAAAHAWAFLWDLPTSQPAPPAAVAGMVERVAEHWARSDPTSAVGGMLEQLSKAPEPLAAAALAGLARGWPAGRAPTLTPREEEVLARWLPRLSPAARGRLVTLTERWGSKALDKYAAEIAAGFLAQVRD